MSLNSRCYCESCGSTYSLFTNETKILPGMKIGKFGRLRSKEYLRSWTDWVEHLATNCPNCRLAEPPVVCVEDYKKLLSNYEKDNQVDDD